MYIIILLICAKAQLLSQESSARLRGQQPTLSGRLAGSGLVVILGTSSVEARLLVHLYSLIGLSKCTSGRPSPYANKSCS